MGQCVQKESVVGAVDYMDTLGNRDCQLASRSVLKDFTDNASTIPNGTVRMLKAYWRRGSNVSVDGTYRCGRLALCGLDE